ncbi:hypothetical protein L6452_02523 [Arctium lappa]|uniref:Uncharacterized protein n=1 Tax=Arctium lappa TaxID=4217 RepID=A0ACB9FJN6_ARCLA|nr:hypothetical protein L6452_02523 [Arctium lappa]
MPRGSLENHLFRKISTSNILLDSDFNAKLFDFGLTTMGPEGSNTHEMTRVMGTYGYAAPEYINTVPSATIWSKDPGYEEYRCRPTFAYYRS